MTPVVRLLAPHYQTPPVKEEEVGAEEEDGDADSPLAGDEGRLVSEGRGHEGVDEERVEPSLPLPQPQLPPQLLLLLPMLPTAFLSKEQRRRIPLHLPRDPVQLLSVLVVLWWRGMVTSVIP